MDDQEFIRQLWNERPHLRTTPKQIIDPIAPPCEGQFHATPFLSGYLSIKFNNSEQHDGKEFRQKLPVELYPVGRPDKVNQNGDQLQQARNNRGDRRNRLHGKNSYSL